MANSKTIQRFASLVGLFCGSLLLTGCGQQLESWVRDARPLNGIPQKFEGQSSVKLSPGTVFSVSQDGTLSARTHITITERKLQGSDVAATVSLNKTRTGVTQ